jgi:uncharacterized membrane protein YhaH (DUF805 family)
MGVVSELLTSGRIGRLAFWLRHLTLVPIGLFVCIASESLLGRPFDMMMSAVLIALLVSTWGRRLHDRGRSAWWLLAAALPVLGPLWLTFECAARRAAPSADRFGPAPGERGDYLAVHER